MKETTKAEPRGDHPDVIAFPPLLFAGALVAGIVLHLLDPRPIAPPLAARGAGALLVVLGCGLLRWGMRTLVAAGTNVNPYEPTERIVSEGPFRHTRNPLYLSLLLIHAGVALLVNGLWVLVLAGPLALVLHFGVVLREERYLATKFPGDYAAYRARVRRWI